MSKVLNTEIIVGEQETVVTSRPGEEEQLRALLSSREFARGCTCWAPPSTARRS
jgi:hypothetical protein